MTSGFYTIWPMIKVASEASQVLIAKVYEANQEHVLAWWDALDAAEQQTLLGMLKEIDFQLLQRLINRTFKGTIRRGVGVSRPLPVACAPPGDDGLRSRMRALGEEAVARGEVAVFMTAGVRGTQIGVSGPEGMCPVGPISQKTLYQLHAEKIVALNRRHRIEIPFFVMTSTETADATLAFFREQRWFGLPPPSVHFVQQPRLPLMDRRGKVVMASRCEMAMAPNGHGGALMLMQSPEVLDMLRAAGCRYVFYFQVNNPFVHVADAEFIGRHVRHGGELSGRCVGKESPDELVGVFVRRGDHVGVIEYLDLPDAVRNEREAATGKLVFDAGNMAVHIFSVSFLDRLHEADGAIPYHLSEQRVACLDRRGIRVQSSEPNCLRFECFAFDAFPCAHKPLLVEADRAEEFYPLRAKRGRYSPEEVMQAMSDRCARWLVRAGAPLAPDAQGRFAGTYEISPLVALDADEFCGEYDADARFTGDTLYLE